MGRKPLDPQIRIANRKEQQKKAYNNFLANGGREKVAKNKKENYRTIDKVSVATKAKFVIAKKQSKLTADKFLNSLLDK